MKNSFFNRTLKGTKFYIVLTLILSAVYSRLLVYIPMFIQYALDGVIMGRATKSDITFYHKFNEVIYT